MKAAERAAKKGGSFGKCNDSDDDHESHMQVNVDLPFMATIARLGNFIEQGKPLIHQTPSSTNSEGKPDDDKQEMSADRRAADDESTISFTDREQEASGKGVGLLAWIQDMPMRISMHRHGSVSLPSSPMLAIKSGSPLKFAARSGICSGTPGLRAGGVECMPASPFLALGPMKGGSPLSPLSAASTRVNADSGNMSRAWEVDSYADSPKVKTSVLKSKNSLVDKIRGLVNPKTLNTRSSDAKSFEGSPLPSNPTSAAGIIGIFVCVWGGGKCAFTHSIHKCTLQNVHANPLMLSPNVVVSSLTLFFFSLQLTSYFPALLALLSLTIPLPLSPPLSSYVLRLLLFLTLRFPRSKPPAFLADMSDYPHSTAPSQNSSSHHAPDVSSEKSREVCP